MPSFWAHLIMDKRRKKKIKTKTKTRISKKKRDSLMKKIIKLVFVIFIEKCKRVSERERKIN